MVLSLQTNRGLNLGLYKQKLVPTVIISNSEDRAWTESLIQGEGSIGTHYVNKIDSTTVDLTVGMTDPEPIFKFSDLCGLSRPVNPRPKPNGYQSVWVKNVAGLRALRILREILPFLTGEKHKEAERALEFFNSKAYHRGRCRSVDVWPPNEFPLRRRTSQTS